MERALFEHCSARSKFTREGSGGVIATAHAAERRAPPDLFARSTTSMKGPKPHRSLPRNLRLMPPEAACNTSKSAEAPFAVPEPPEWLADDASTIYSVLAAEMKGAGYWSPRFEDALALYSSLAAEYRSNPKGCSAAKVTQMRLLLSELGLTPQSARGLP